MYRHSLFTLMLIFSLLGNSNAQVSTVNIYAFGHSLIDHRPPAIPTPSDETTIMHWMNDIALHAGTNFSGTGQYGFLTTHSNLPPASNWGYNNVPTSWDDSMGPFSSSGVNTLLITAANFIQYVAPSDPHPLDNSTTVLQETETIFDWVNAQQPGVRYYIYGNWPEMNLQSGFPPNLPLQSEIDAFHSTTMGAFTNWWKDYQDGMLLSRPGLNTRLIPVGSVISELLSVTLAGQIPFDELYEDSAPHGRATVYFLAGMITYMAVYGQDIPATYVPDTTVHAAVRNNMSAVRSVAWNALLDFNFANGTSRVFFPVCTDTGEQAIQYEGTLFPNPVESDFRMNVKECVLVRIGDIHGRLFTEQIVCPDNGFVEMSSLASGVYYVQWEDPMSGIIRIERVVKR